MFIITNDKGALINFIISANEDDSVWSLEYAAPGFFFYSDDALLNSAVEHYVTELGGLVE
jgi:hypothetical protein